MSQSTHRLSISGPAGAVFRVTDGSARCAGLGMHRLELNLPRGIYSIVGAMGSSVQTREVLLDEPQIVDFTDAFTSFGSQAFAVAGAVKTACGAHRFGHGGQVIALRGPWLETPSSENELMLDRDGTPIDAVAHGVVDDEVEGFWTWQLFDLGPTNRDGGGKAATLSLSRLVCEAEKSPPAASPEREHAHERIEPAAKTRVSHIVPHWGDWTIWAAYPATACRASRSESLPISYYLRMRLTPPGELPDASLQTLSDQVFTALAARTGLPLTAPALDLLLTDDADPLLVLAAAHVASITLASVGLLDGLPHDAAVSPQSASPDPDANELSRIDTVELRQRFADWLQRHAAGPMANVADMVSVCFLFGIADSAHVQDPPVLLRSLDGLIAMADSTESAPAGTRFDESVWGQRLQVSDSFAFLQWLPDQDYRQQILENMRRSLQSFKAMQETARRIAEATANYEEPALGVVETPSPQASSPRPRAIAPTDAASANLPPALDLEAFIKSSVTTLRIPKTAVNQFGSALKSVLDQTADPDRAADLARELADRLKESGLGQHFDVKFDTRRVGGFVHDLASRLRNH